jgi:hypothetical protein
MELIEIIKSSLSIFSTTTFVFVTISYTIYKIKVRSRIKPYLRTDVQEPLNGIAHDQICARVNINMEEKSAEEGQMKKIVFVKLPIQNKFTIINENLTADKLSKPAQRKENSTLLPNDSKKNIYDIFISPNEKIHKLKVEAR